MRAAIAVVFPFLAVAWLTPSGAVWMNVAGFLGTLADKGGASRTRAGSIIGVGVAGSVSVAVAALLAPHPVASVVAMTVWAVGCAIVRVYGAGPSSVGSSVAALFAISLGLPVSSVKEALGRGAFVLLGGAWALVLALVLWPVRLYRPARVAIAGCYRELARHVRLMMESLPNAGEVSWQGLQRNHSALRASLEAGRAALAATRRGRRGESGRGARLLILIQVADQALAALVAAEDILESAGLSAASPSFRTAVAFTLEGVATRLEGIAADVEQSEPPRVANSGRPAEVPLHEGNGPELEHLAALFGRLKTLFDVAGEVVASLHDDSPISKVPTLGEEPKEPSTPFWEPLLQNLNFSSTDFRHALRVGITAAVAVTVVRALGLSHGYWVTLTVIILLQPYTPATVVKTVQRIGGTTLGALVAAGIATYVDAPWAIMTLVAVLAGMSAAFLQLNYGLYSLFLTPTFILLTELHSHDVTLPKVRVMNTVLGGTLAFLGARLLWPTRERAKFPEHMAAALHALREYIDVVIDAVAQNATVPHTPISAARRKFGLAINNADASFQRFLMESYSPAESFEPQMTLLLYARRTVGASAALASVRHFQDASAAQAVLRRVGSEVNAQLQELEEAVSQGRRPSAMPKSDDLMGAVDDPVLKSRLERLLLQLSVLRDAAVRARF